MKESFIKKLFKGLMWNQLRYYGSYPLIFLLSIVLARGLGATDYGMYTGLMAVIGILVLISSFGFEGVSLVSLPKIQNEKNAPEISYFIKRLLLKRIIISIVVMTVVFMKHQQLFSFMGLKDVSSIDLIIVFLLFFILSNINLILNSFYKGLMRFRALAIIDTFTYFLNLILCFFILKFTKNLSLIFLALSVVQLVTMVIYGVGMRMFFFQKSKKFNFRDIRSLSFNIFGIRINEYVLGHQKDILLLSYFFQNPMLLGFYNIAIRLAELLNGLFTMGFGEVSQPSFSEAFSKKGEDGIRKLWYGFMRLEMLLIIPILVFTIFHADSIIRILYSERYLSAVPVFKLFCMILIISNGILGGGKSQQILFAMNKQKLAFNIVLLAGMMNVLLSLILIPIYDTMGAAFATGASIILWRIGHLLFVFRYVSVAYPFRFLFKILIAIFVSISLSNFIEVNKLLSLCFAGGVYLILFIIMIYIIKPFELKDKAGLTVVNSKFEKYLAYFCK